jgi:hypothetical protein
MHVAPPCIKIVDHLDNEKIEKTFLLDETGSRIGQITGHFQFVLASLIVA